MLPKSEVIFREPEIQTRVSYLYSVSLQESHPKREKAHLGRILRRLWLSSQARNQAPECKVQASQKKKGSQTHLCGTGTHSSLTGYLEGCWLALLEAVESGYPSVSPLVQKRTTIVGGRQDQTAANEQANHGPPPYVFHGIRSPIPELSDHTFHDPITDSILPDHPFARLKKWTSIRCLGSG
ncbi:MAG: hypothetical protein V2A78_10565, partial [bacterium]